jgi:hypothetical protein
MKLFTTIILAVLFITTSVFSENQTKECQDCPLPKHPDSKAAVPDSTMDVNFKNYLPTIYDVRSVKRDIIHKYGKSYQALKLKMIENGKCKDTTVLLSDVERLSVTGLGINGQTLIIPVYPAREYYSSEEISLKGGKYTEFTFNTGYVGSDDSDRQIGTSGIPYDINLIISPLSLMDKKFNIGFGAGLHFSDDQLRIPVIAEVRYNILGAINYEKYFNYYPSPCKFGIDGEEKIEPEDSKLVEISTTAKTDSTVYFYEAYREVKSKYRLFAFVDAGYYFDTDFEGAYSTPSLNPEDYGQFFISAGVGMPFYKYFTAKIFYKYSRLNQRTPCQACTKSFVVNTNNLQGIFLGIGFNLDY